MELVDLLQGDAEGEGLFVRLQLGRSRGASPSGSQRAFEAVMPSVLDVSGRDVRKATVARSFGYLKTRYFAWIC
nr:hypothetical protein [Xanthomonas campestris]